MKAIPKNKWDKQCYYLCILQSGRIEGVVGQYCLADIDGFDTELMKDRPGVPHCCPIFTGDVRPPWLPDYHRISQGTISVLIGSHSIGHSILVWRSWQILYHKSPNFTETCCILLHDVGHWGKNYLDDESEKRKHWILGAKIAQKLFGLEAFWLCAGHDFYSGYPESKMYRADKYSWYIAPYWWIYWNNITEPALKCGMKSREACIEFMSKVKASVESGQFVPSHDMYIERRMRQYGQSKE